MRRELGGIKLEKKLLKKMEINESYQDQNYVKEQCIYLNLRTEQR